VILMSNADLHWWYYWYYYYYYPLF